jgi:hypothetical protein
MVAAELRRIAIWLRFPSDVDKPHRNEGSHATRPPRCLSAWSLDRNQIAIEALTSSRCGLSASNADQIEPAPVDLTSL